MADILEILLRISAATGDTDERLSAIERRLNEIDHKHAEATVDVNDGGAQAKLNEIHNRLARLATELARPRVEIDAARAKAELAEIERDLASISHDSGGARIRLDDALAKVEIDRLKAQLDELSRPRTIHIREEFSKVKEDLSQIGERLTSMPRLLTALSPALIPMVGTLAQAVVGAGALAVAAGGAAASFGVLGFAVQQSVKNGVEGGARVKSAWQGLQQTFTSVMAGGVTAVNQGLVSIMGMVRGALPELRAPFDTLGQAVKGALTSPEIHAGVAQLITDFGQLVRASAPLAGPLLQSLVHLGDILINIARAAMPDLVKLAQEFADWLGRIAAKTQDQERLRQKIHEFVDTFRQVLSALEAVVRAFVPLLEMSSQLAPLVTVVANLVGAFLRLLQTLGPLGQIILTGLGIAFIIGKFSLWAAAIRDLIGVFRGLKEAGAVGGVFAAAAGALGGFGNAARGVKAAITALIAGDGIAGAIGAYRDMTAATRLAKTAEDDLIPTKQREKGAASEAAVEDTALARSTSLVARAAPLAATALAGAAVAIAASGSRIQTAGRSAFQGLVNSAQSVAGPVRSMASNAMTQAALAINSGAGTLRTAANAGFQVLPQAARNVAAPTRTATGEVMRSVGQVISSAAGTVRSSAQQAWNPISIALSQQNAPTSAAGRSVAEAGAGAIRNSTGLVMSASRPPWETIPSVLSSMAPKVGLAALAVLGVGASAVLTAGPLIGAAAANTSERIPSAVRAVGPGVGTAGSVVMQALASAVSAGAGVVGGAAQSAASAIRSPIEALGSGLAGIGSSIMQNLASGITSGAGAAISAAASAAAGIRAQLPGSEPKDPRSPLRNLSRAGEAIVANVAAGIRPGLFQAAMMRALALPNAHLGVSIPATLTGLGAAAGAAAPMALTANVNIQALHPADPNVQRAIAQGTVEAMRRNIPRKPPVRA